MSNGEDIMIREWYWEPLNKHNSNCLRWLLDVTLRDVDGYIFNIYINNFTLNHYSKWTFISFLVWLVLSYKKEAYAKPSKQQKLDQYVVIGYCSQKWWYWDFIVCTGGILSNQHCVHTGVCPLMYCSVTLQWKLGKGKSTHWTDTNKEIYDTYSALWLWDLYHCDKRRLFNAFFWRGRLQSPFL